MNCGGDATGATATTIGGGDGMDYPDRWKEKLADEEERQEIATRHWRPNLWHVLVLLALMIVSAVAFWPGGCAAGG
ncbi:MAG: hypothetical protein ACOC7J_03440 [Armatimonadota bacterium]